MNMKYYNASNNFSAPVKREPKPYSPYTRRPEVIVPQRPHPRYDTRKEEHSPEQSQYRTRELKNTEISAEKNVDKKINLSNLKADDLLLLGIIAVLIWNSCDDTLLILALGYLFLAGI